MIGCFPRLGKMYLNLYPCEMLCIWRIGFPGVTLVIQNGTSISDSGSEI